MIGVRDGEDVLAEQVARLAFVDKVDKQGAPYIHHLERVSRAAGTLLERTVGWLHDAIEDTVVTEEMLKVFGFSDETISAVLVVTRRPGETYKDFIHRIKTSGNAPAIRVKVLDLKDNKRPGCPPDLQIRYDRALAELDA